MDKLIRVNDKTFIVRKNNDCRQYAKIINDFKSCIIKSKKNIQIKKKSMKFDFIIQKSILFTI